MNIENENLNEPQKPQLNILAVRRQLLPDLTLEEIHRIAERHLKNRTLDASWQ